MSNKFYKLAPWLDIPNINLYASGPIVRSVEWVKLYNKFVNYCNNPIPCPDSELLTIKSSDIHFRWNNWDPLLINPDLVVRDIFIEYDPNIKYPSEQEKKAQFDNQFTKHLINFNIGLAHKYYKLTLKPYIPYGSIPILSIDYIYQSYCSDESIETDDEPVSLTDILDQLCFIDESVAEWFIDLFMSSQIIIKKFIIWDKKSSNSDIIKTALRSTRTSFLFALSKSMGETIEYIYKLKFSNMSELILHAMNSNDVSELDYLFGLYNIFTNRLGMKINIKINPEDLTPCVSTNTYRNYHEKFIWTLAELSQIMDWALKKSNNQLMYWAFDLRIKIEIIH